MVGGVGREAFDLDLDRQKIGIGLGEDARRHQAALGQKLERARQHAGFGVGFETVSDGGELRLRARTADMERLPRMTDERQTLRFAVQTGVLIRRPRRSMRAMATL